MEKQILNLLTEMNNEMKGMKSDIHSLRSEMHNRFDTIEAKLEGVGNQFELTNESRINERDFISSKMSKMEKELYILKNKNSN
ncbi:hypothetical protein CFK37_09560 [Virgibacillus phasianinus]|uniref:Uncharacterized protein n=1 Tax=Virgibacillus phasianinus TaxID=2017483 RepID=A0A220U2X6_9BACI|nr:hypothetical protein [Virgibacillus phasianinus]ASK62385.1 hypothetical protein CFK37_09560 [Virgibacillus phasianinus]